MKAQSWIISKIILQAIKNTSCDNFHEVLILVSDIEKPRRMLYGEDNNKL